uniref:Uncharacterized protein n=1 Tax=Glossina pallidipes TaxID=7398 RepID=A0A1A9ZB39_GLOPL
MLRIWKNTINVPKHMHHIQCRYERHKSKSNNYEDLMRQEKLKELKLRLKRQVLPCWSKQVILKFE